MKYLSIIIPSYNMENYLSRAIGSITVCRHLHDMEVIVVNDGSKDSTSRIAHQYANQYTGDVIVIDKQNGNYGSCINAGLEVATAKYIKVLDADDYLHSDNLDGIMDILSGTDADMLITPFCKVDAEGCTQPPRHINLIPHKVYQTESLRKNKTILGIWMHEIIYRRQLLIDMGYRQTPGIGYTDMEWGFIPLLCVKTVEYIPTLLYYYQIGREGQSVDPAVHRRRYSEEITVTRSMLQALSQSEAYHTPTAVRQLLIEKMIGRLKTIYRQILIVYLDEENKELETLTDWVKATLPDVFTRLMKLKLSTPLFPCPFIRWWYTRKKPRLRACMTRAYRRYKHLN
jgi:glycosyltransferase involved in cell wall biosynthesis